MLFLDVIFVLTQTAVQFNLNNVSACEFRRLKTDDCFKIVFVSVQLSSHFLRVRHLKHFFFEVICSFLTKRKNLPKFYVSFHSRPRERHFSLLIKLIQISKKNVFISVHLYINKKLRKITLPASIIKENCPCNPAIDQ